MTPAGRLSAAVEVLSAVIEGHKPGRLALKAWGERARYAGSGDRAWVSGLVLDALRHRRSLGWRMGDDSPRALCLGALRFAWGWTPEAVAEAAGAGPHALGALTDEEARALAEPRPLHDAPPAVRGDYPDWLDEPLHRAFGDRLDAEAAAFATRAPVDLRANTLKASADKVLRELESFGAAPSGVLRDAVRIAAPEASKRTAPVESLPEFAKGWFEVQDLGSQLAAAAAGEVRGKQVLDLCAGGGGKTLALAAAMGNTGQIHAYDVDAKRLSEVVTRGQRAGVRNLQVRSPVKREPLKDLAARMDLVFVDAPCTGTGTWRRHPDAKWRLQPRQLEQRIADQDAVLEEAHAACKPGGRIVYVTCSILREENEDRVAAFRERHGDYEVLDALEAVQSSGLLTAPQTSATPASASGNQSREGALPPGGEKGWDGGESFSAGGASERFSAEPLTSPHPEPPSPPSPTLPPSRGKGAIPGLSSNPSARKIDSFGSLRHARTPEGYLRLSPATSATDGFFVAVLQRNR